MAIPKKHISSVSTVVFDCDDTLWSSDFLRDLIAVAESLQIPQENIISFAKALQKAVWQVFDFHLDNKVTRDSIEIALERLLSNEISAYGITSSSIYDALSHPTFCSCQADPESLDVISYLYKKGYKLVVKSDWFSNVQINHMQNFGYLQYFEFIVGPVGDYFKPDPRGAAKIIGSNDPSHFVMIGDSQNRDVQFANNVGMFSIWINKGNNLRISGKKFSPTYEIQRLSELKSIL